MDGYHNLQNMLDALPSLNECRRLSESTFSTLYTLLHEQRTHNEFRPLIDALSEYISQDEDHVATQLENLSNRSAYFLEIERSFIAEWNDSNIENSSILINSVSSVWIASRTLVDIRQELHTVIMLYCPPAYNLTAQEIDTIWDTSYPPMDAEVSELCSSKSKHVSNLPNNTLLSFSEKWVDILLQRLQFHPFESNPSFDPMIYIAMKLHSLAGRLVTKCKEFHTCYSPRVIPSLNSILTKCPVILENFAAIEQLIKKRPICAFVQDCIPGYTHDNVSIDVLRKQAKQFQIQFASLSDDLERYLTICRYTKLKDHYAEVFLISSDDDFDLDEFEEVMNEIQERWDLRVEGVLSKYTEQLEFIHICHNFQNELTNAREFLSQYECTRYPEYDLMNEHKKDINNYIFSSHWIDSRQQEKVKLLQLIRKFGEESLSDDEDTSSDCELYDTGEVAIIDKKIGCQLVRIIENDYRDFIDLHEAIRDYYEQGIEMWRDFLYSVRDFDENISKKNYLLTAGFLKFDNASHFPQSVRNLRVETADLENFANAHANLQYSGDELCKLCEGSCQEFIQRKLGQFCDQIEEMRAQADGVYNELNPLVRVIMDIYDNVKKVEDILVETQEKIEGSVEEYSQAKPDVFMSYLRSRMSSLKKRTAKLSTGRHQLEPLLKIEPLDLSLLVRRYDEAESKLENILCYLSEKLQEVILVSLEKTRKQIIFGESNLDSYEPFFQSLSNDFPHKSSDFTKRLSQFQNFFNDDYFDEIQQSIDNLIEASKELTEEDVKVELVKLEDSLATFEISVRSNKILMHFAITYHELNEVLKLRETFLQASCKPSYIADKLGFVANQIEELFGQDFKICHTYYRLLRSRYNEYLSDENQPPILPLSLEIVSRLESAMRERLDVLELSFNTFNQTFQEIDTCITQFRLDSQNILAFAEKIETAFSNRETSIRDSSVLDTQVTAWELLLIEGQSCLSAYDESFEHASKIYDTLLPSPKVELVKTLFPKSNEHLDELKTCLAFFHKFQADLKVNEDGLSALTNNISHFYTEMRFPSISTNGSASGKSEQKCKDFQHELQCIATSVRAVRNSLPELQAGTHQFVEYSIIEEDRLKTLEDKLPEWENKISGLSQECNQLYAGQFSGESGYNGQLSFDIISLTSDRDSGSYATSEEPLSEESRKIKNKLAKWKSWMKRKEKAHVMNSEISNKLSDAQLQKKEIDITKLEFERKHRDFQALLSNKESQSTFYQKHIQMYKELEPLFIHFEVIMSKRCEEVTSRVSSLLELHLLISLCEQRLMSVQTNIDTAQDSQFTLEEQVIKVTDIRNELRDCEKDCIDRIRDQYSTLTNTESPCGPLEFSSDNSTESHSESDTDEKHTSSFLSTSQTSLLLPSIPCREQIQKIETNHQELHMVVTELISTLTAQQDKAHQLTTSLHTVNERIMGATNTLSDESSLINLTTELDSLKREYISLEYSYTSMQRHYSPSLQESQLQHDVKQSMTNLQGVINGNTAVDRAQGKLLSPTAPIRVEFLFEPKMNQTLPPLLTGQDIPRINLSPEVAQNFEHPQTKSFALITETLDFFQHFSPAGPHTEDSSQQFITDVQNRYTECHTDVISVLNATAGLTNALKIPVHEWLDITRKVRDTLKGRLETRRCEWEELVEKYNTANGYVNALENDLESFKGEEWANEAEFENAVECSAEYLQERIECYNEFSPRMYQLIVCDTCEDGSCQGWRDRLNTFRNKLTTMHAEFNNLLHREPVDSDSFIVISPIESTPPTPSHTVESAPSIKPDNPHIERTPLVHLTTRNPSMSCGGCLETTLSSFYFLVHFLLVLVVVFSMISFRYVRSANSNLKGPPPQ